MKKKILIVDDDTLNREGFAMFFTDLGYDVVTAADGRQGLSRVRQEAPDIILLDLSMPRLGGGDFLRLMADMEGYAGTPVVVLSGAPEQVKDLLEDAPASVVRAIVKPTPPELLAAVIASALAARQDGTK